MLFILRQQLENMALAELGGRMDEPEDLWLGCLIAEPNGNLQRWEMASSPGNGRCRADVLFCPTATSFFFTCCLLILQGKKEFEHPLSTLLLAPLAGKYSSWEHILLSLSLGKH